MKELEEQVLNYNRELKEALETILAALNQGQRKKLLRNEKVQAICERFHIEV